MINYFRSDHGNRAKMCLAYAVPLAFQLVALVIYLSVFKLTKAL